MTNTTSPRVRARRTLQLVEGTAAPQRQTRRSNLRLFSAPEETDQRMLAVRSILSSDERAIDDPFAETYGLEGAGTVTVLEPTYDYRVLMSLPNENHTLKQCIEAMVTNIERFGHRLEYIGPEDAQQSAEAQAERERIDALLDTPNGEYSFIELRSRLRADRETFGASYMEVLRDNDGAPASMHHLPAFHMRKTKKLSDPITVATKVWRAGKLVEIRRSRRFRLYVQRVGGRTVYFKELGDPRTIDYQTGQVLDNGTGKTKAANALNRAASEVLEFSEYTPGFTYGLPRWINQLPAVIGSREAEVTNLSFFKDNAIPAMAILVAGGALTEASAQLVDSAFAQHKGRSAMNRVLVLEALGDEQAADSDGKIPPPTVTMQPLTGNRQGDSLFGEYDKDNHVKIRSSFRLPPLFLGRSEDYTRASAEVSMVVAETQVFGPERNVFDETINAKLLLDKEGVPPQYWRVRSNPARLVAPEALMDALATFDAMGAMTPNIAIGLANELFDLNIEEIQDDWGNLPFSFATQGATASLATAADVLEQTGTEEEEEVTKALRAQLVKVLRTASESGKKEVRRVARKRVRLPAQ
ncbi:hypothetical protein H10PHJ05_29 [Aeromonas phage HJ05]|nr:hypothetical protein H10PHJ05_29 [Aeromonas phage HJ05]